MSLDRFLRIANENVEAIAQILLEIGNSYAKTARFLSQENAENKDQITILAEEAHMIMCFHTLACGILLRREVDEEGGKMFFSLIRNFQSEAKIQGSLAWEMREALRVHNPTTYILIEDKDHSLLGFSSN